MKTMSLQDFESSYEEVFANIANLLIKNNETEIINKLLDIAKNTKYNRFTDKVTGTQISTPVFLTEMMKNSRIQYFVNSLKLCDIIKANIKLSDYYLRKDLDTKSKLKAEIIVKALKDNIDNDYIEIAKHNVEYMLVNTTQFTSPKEAFETIIYNTGIATTLQHLYELNKFFIANKALNNKMLTF